MTAQLAVVPQFAHAQKKQDKQQHHDSHPPEHAKASNPGQQKNHPYADGAWLRRYENAPADRGEQALRSERDFQKLPPDRQQQLVNRFHDFASKPPEERQRLVQRLQEIEKMPPQEREQLQQANQMRKTLEPDRKRQVNRAYNFLRELPPGQQEQVLNSSSFQQRFSDQERGILRGLLKAPQIEPPLGAAPNNNPHP
jgi:hypothetical protein